MADQAKRGGQKKGGAEHSREHQGVRPDSTTQNKHQRQKQAEKRFDKKTRVMDDKPQARD